MGLTAEERVQFDAMQEADSTIPSEPETPEPSETPEPPAPGEQPPPAPVEEPDEPDSVVRDPKTGKEQKTVNYNKHQRLLSKAEQRAATAMEETARLRINQARAEERLAILNEALTAPIAPPPLDPAEAQRQAMAENPLLEPTIPVEQDALAAIAQANRRIEYLANQISHTQQETLEVREERELKEGFIHDSQLFSQTEQGAHFFGGDGAYQYLKNSRLTELGISLFDKDPTDPNEVFTQAQINQMIADFNAEEKWVVQNAKREGKSPSVAIMKLAKGRGWKAPVANGNGAAAPVPAPVAQQPRAAVPAPARLPAAAAAPQSVVAKLAAETQGASASRSLSDGGGVPTPPELTMERLVAMTDPEFNAYMESLPPDRLQSLMGRSFPVGQ
jgi:hypothetical protein